MKTSGRARRPRSRPAGPDRTPAPAAGACSRSPDAAAATPPTPPARIRSGPASPRAGRRGARRAGTGSRQPSAIFSSSAGRVPPAGRRPRAAPPRPGPAGPERSSRHPRAPGRSIALRISGDPLLGREAITQPTGTVARRAGSVRRAAAVPLSAHCRSSRHTSTGGSSAARSSNASRSWSSQYLCSGDVCASLRPSRPRIGDGPANKASISADSWTTLSPGSATPTPDPDRQVARHRSHLRQEPLLPMPAPTLHQGDGSDAGEDLVKVPAQGRSSMSRPRTGCADTAPPGRIARRGHYGPFDPVNVSDMSPGHDLMTAITRIGDDHRRVRAASVRSRSTATALRAGCGGEQ